MNCLAVFSLQSLLRVLAFHSTIIFWALIVIMVVSIFIWAAFFRSPSRRKSARHHWKSKDGVPDKNGAPSAPVRSGRRRHKRRRPRKPLNPTLAQTHGLPPVRDERSTPPPAY
jgi:hypothetical protein